DRHGHPDVDAVVAAHALIHEAAGLKGRERPAALAHGRRVCSAGGVTREWHRTASLGDRVARRYEAAERERHCSGVAIRFAGDVTSRSGSTGTRDGAIAELVTATLATLRLAIQARHAIGYQRRSADLAHVLRSGLSGEALRR